MCGLGLIVKVISGGMPVFTGFRTGGPSRTGGEAGPGGGLAGEGGRAAAGRGVLAVLIWNIKEKEGGWSWFGAMDLWMVLGLGCFVKNKEKAYYLFFFSLMKRSKNHPTT
jgi:hypothetical protein